MTARAQVRGHFVESVGKEWIYSDTKKPIDDNRPCARCGCLPTKDGHDACLGHIEGAEGACCGHGAEKGYIIKDGKRSNIS